MDIYITATPATAYVIAEEGKEWMQEPEVVDCAAKKYLLDMTRVVAYMNS